MIYAQVLITVFIIFALSRAFLRLRESKLTLNSFMSWTILWLSVILVVWRPTVTGDVAKMLGIGRGADLLLYISIIVLFYSIFRIYIRLEEIDRDISQITRIIAINKPLKTKKKKSR